MTPATTKTRSHSSSPAPSHSTANQIQPPAIRTLTNNRKLPSRLRIFATLVKATLRYKARLGSRNFQHANNFKKGEGPLLLTPPIKPSVVPSRWLCPKSICVPHVGATPHAF